MIKVAQYIQTVGSEKYLNILNQPFEIEMLSILSKESTSKTVFDGWRGKNMLNWHKFTNDDGHVLEFYPEYYIIKKAVGGLKMVVHQLPLPKTINDFIYDMFRFEIQLYWGEWIDEVLEPKDYMDKNEIEGYYVNLLNKIGKSHELH